MIYTKKKAVEKIIKNFISITCALIIWLTAAQHTIIQKSIEIPVYTSDHHTNEMNMIGYSTLTYQTTQDKLLFTNLDTCKACISQEVILKSNGTVSIPFSSISVPPEINVIHCNSVQTNIK